VYSMKYVVADFESTPQKIIHSLSFIPVVSTETKQWVSHGRGTNPEYRKHRNVTRGILRTIFIEESLSHELVQNSERTIQKLGKTIIHGRDVTILPFREALATFIRAVLEEGDGNWLAHAMDNELEIVQATDEHLKTHIFPKPLRSFPDVANIPGWSRISKVCTQQLLTCRCPEFFHSYSSWMTMNGWSAVKFSSRLEDFTRFVRNDREYTQRHIAPLDVLDLCEVLAVAHPPIDGKSFMVSKPVSEWYGTQKKTTSALPPLPC